MTKRKSKEYDVVGEFSTQDALNDAGYYSVAQTAEALGFTDRQIFRYIKDRRLTGKYASAWRSQTYRVLLIEEVDLLVKVKGTRRNITEEIWGDFIAQRNT